MVRSEDQALLECQKTLNACLQVNADSSALDVSDTELAQRTKAQRDDAFGKLESASRPTHPMVWVTVGVVVGVLAGVGIASIEKR